MKNFKNILWGLAIVAFGVLWILNTAGVLANLFFDGWWTLFLIVPAIIGIITEKNKTFSVILLIIGAALLAGQYIEFSKIKSFIFPVILVVIGLSIAFGGFVSKNNARQSDQLTPDGKAYAEYSAAFSRQDLAFSSEFNGGKFSVFCGGMKIDLTHAAITRNVTLDTSAVFGGIDIYVPRYVRVVTNTNSVFGGITDKTATNLPPETVTVFINSQNVFGGTEIKYM